MHHAGTELTETICFPRASIRWVPHPTWLKSSLCSCCVMSPSHTHCVSDQDLLSWLLCFSRPSHGAVRFMFILRQFISLNACGSGALLHAHPTCCIRICCRAVVLLTARLTSDTFLRLSMSACPFISADLIM